MKLEDFAYILETKKSFEDAVVSVLNNIEKRGWTVFSIYDLRERLAAKGFNHNKMKIIEICSARYADKFLKKNSFVSLCMPCKINVIENNGKIKIIGMRPSMLSQFFPEIIKAETEEVEKDIINIIDESA